MYILTSGQSIIKYPFSINELKRNNPNISFPSPLTSELLEEWGVFEVESTIPTYDSSTQKAIESTPTFDGSKWIQTWTIEDLTENEIQVNLLKKVDYISFYNSAINSQVYSEIRTQALTSLPLTVALTEFISAMTDAKSGRENRVLIQSCISNILQSSSLTDENIAELQQLLTNHGLAPFYVLTSTPPEQPIDTTETTGGQ